MRFGLAAACLLLILAVPVAAHFDHLTTSSQVSPDRVVYIEKAFVSEAVWLVLHADDDGEKGAPIGHTMVTPGDHMLDVPVSISEDAWQETDAARTIWVDLYWDNGDEMFDPDTDSSLTERGLFPPTSFVVRPGQARAYVGVEDLNTQRTTGSIDVRRVVLPKDGNLVIHNVSRGSPAEVIGHATLPAGDHRNVTVDLDHEFYNEQPNSFRVVAVVYTDDGDGQFTKADQPVSVGDDNVSSEIRVSKRSSNDTPTPDESELVTTPVTSATDKPDGSEMPGSRFFSTQPITVSDGLLIGVSAIVLLLAIGWLRAKR